METLRTFRERKGLTQDKLASLAGVAGPTISLLESGDRGLSPDLATKLASHLGERVTAKKLLNIQERLVAGKQAIAELGQHLVATKSADPADALAAATKLAEIEADESLPEEVREAARDVSSRAVSTAVKSATQELAAGVTGSWTTPPGSTLDPDLDPASLRVASAGNGQFYVLDLDSGQVVLIFGDVVQQQGQSSGDKATKSQKDNRRRDALGRSRRYRRS